MKIITVNKGDTNPLELFKDNDIIVTGSSHWKQGLIKSIDLEITTKIGIEEQFVSANFCDKCDKNSNCGEYKDINVYVLELHFVHSQLDHITEGRIPKLESGQPPKFLDLEINGKTTYVIVSKLLHENINEVIPCKSFNLHQPKTKKGNILIGN